MNQLPLQARIRIASALVEGGSIRSTERLTGIHRDSITRFGVLAGEACARFHHRFVTDIQCSTVQVDEIWTYVKKKQKRVRQHDPEECGDQYVFVGMDADTKLIIGYRVGKRDGQTTHRFVADLRARILNRPQITSDGFAPYTYAVADCFGNEIPYAQVVKQYVGDDRPQAAHRYSPGAIRGATKTVISGDPDESKISTSYIERQNLTMRMQMRRFARLTNGFSKRLRNLDAAVALHFAHFNFCRVHETIRRTPAMAAGLTDHVWSLAELLDAAFAAPVPPSLAPESHQGRSVGQAKGEKGGGRLRLYVLKGGKTPK